MTICCATSTRDFTTSPISTTASIGSINAAAPNRFIDDFYDIITLIFHYHYQWNKRDERQRNEVAIREHLATSMRLLTRDRRKVEAAFSEAIWRLPRATMLTAFAVGDSRIRVEKVVIGLLSGERLIFARSDSGGSMSKSSLARKLPAAIIALAVVVAAGVGFSGYLIATQTAESITFDRLSSIALDRSKLLAQFLASHELAVQTAARSETAQNAIRDLRFGWVKLVDGQSDKLIDAYITKNPNEPDKRNDLLDGGTGSNYDTAHARFHANLRTLQETGGYEDLYLFDAEGHMIYSVRKNGDFAQSFGPGSELGKSQLADVFARAMEQGRGAAQRCRTLSYNWNCRRLYRGPCRRQARPETGCPRGTTVRGVARQACQRPGRTW